MPASFDHPKLLETLEAMELTDFNGLDFGLITMDRTSVVIGYNAFEASRAGISPGRVLGKRFFDHMGLCMNNYLVAQRYLDERELDATIDYVLTLRMAPTPVRLRMMARDGSPRQYLAIQNR